MLLAKNKDAYDITDAFPERRKDVGDYCVYLHHKSDGEIFYVGKGLTSRPFNFSSRSEEWKSTASNGYVTTILYDGMSNDLSLDVERLLISIIGIDNLVNKTMGGGGAKGYKHSQAHKLYMSSRMSGDNNPMSGRFGSLNPNYGVPCPEHIKEANRVPRPDIRGDGNGSADVRIWEFVNKNGIEFVGTRCQLQAKYGVTPRDVSKICSGGRKSSKGWMLKHGKP